jgi:hypothetical protein
MNKIKTLKLDVTNIIKEKHVCDMCLGNIKNLPLILVGEEYYDILDCTLTTKRKEETIGVVTSNGVLYNSLDGKFYIDVQTFYELAYGFADSCEFTIIDDILNISAFIIYE